MKLYNIANIKDIETFAPELKKFIEDHKLTTTYEGKNYALVDAWKFAGLNFGLTCIPEQPVRMQPATEIKYSCEAKVIESKSRELICAGYSICSNQEESKKGSPENTICSMAQTRAIAKAYRNLLGFLMQVAGFESTPAEEMEDVKIKAIPAKIDKEKERILRFIEKAESLPELEKLQPQINIPELTKVYNKKRKLLLKTTEK